MKRSLIAVTSSGILACLAMTAAAQSTEASVSIPERQTLTNRWFGLGEQAESAGVTADLGLTQLYQINLNTGRGLMTHRHSGRWTGSYDLNVELDFGKILGLTGGVFSISAEGSWSDGLDASSVGSLFGVNGDAGGNRSIDVTESYYQQTLLNDQVTIGVGKLDLSNWFDGNALANDETAQFIHGALVNNPTIPFPENGLGGVVMIMPTDAWYVAVGAADAQADYRKTGFSTAFHDEDAFIAMLETGYTPKLGLWGQSLAGAYRAGMWYDPQDKAYNDAKRIGTKNDDLGWYLSFDQMVWNENSDDDGQGLGLFMRAGWTDDEVNTLATFWSFGGQYQGVIPSRDNDVLGLGVAQGNLSPEIDLDSRQKETAVELYYNVAVTPWCHVTPNVQWVDNPGADGSVADAVVLGIRAQITF